MLDFFSNFARLDAERQRYLLSNLSAHLAEAKQYSRLYALVEKPWMNLKFEYTLSHRAFADDVNLAAQVAADDESPEGLVQLVRTSLIYAILTSLATDISPKLLGLLAELGQAEKARGYAALIHEPEKQSIAYRLIAEALLAQKNFMLAHGSLKGAIRAAEAIKDEGRKAYSLRDVAQVLVQARELDWALRTLETIKGTLDKSEVLRDVVHTLAQIGEFDRALQVVEAIKIESYRAEALSSVAQAMAQAGVKERVTDIAVRASVMMPIYTEPYIPTVLPGVVRAMVQAGQKEQAEKIVDNALLTAKRIKIRGGKVAEVEILCSIAQAMTQAGQRGQAAEITRSALTIAETIRDGYESKALSTVAQVVTLAGDFDRILQAAKRIPDVMFQAEALRPIAYALAQAGEYDHALQAAEAIIVRYEVFKDRTLQDVTRAMAQGGEVERALQTVEMIVDEISKADALINMAEIVGQAGKKEKATEIANCALQLAETIGTEIDKNYRLRTKNQKIDVLSNAASIMVRVGQKQRAIELVSRVLRLVETVKRDFEHSNVQMWSSIAQAIAQENNFRYAGWIAETIGDEASKVKTLCIIAEAMTQVEQKEQAVKVASRALEVVELIEEEWYKAEALCSVAEVMAQAGQREHAIALANRALRMAERISDEESKVEMLCGITKAMAQVGDFDRALQVAGMLKNKDKPLSGGNRDKALSGVVQAMVQMGEFDCALEMTKTIIYERYKAEALRRLALAVVQAGQKSRLSSLLDIAKTLWHADFRAAALGGVAQAMAQTGDFDGALQVEEDVAYSASKAEVLSDVAVGIAQAGDFDRALQVTETIYDKWSKAKAQRGVALALAQGGQYNLARQMLCTALTDARLAGHNRVFEMLERDACLLAAIDQGQTLWRVYLAIREVERWWG